MKRITINVSPGVIAKLERECVIESIMDPKSTDCVDAFAKAILLGIRKGEREINVSLPGEKPENATAPATGGETL